MYDIAIIGGGPAGSSLARYLSPRYKVCILERRSYSGKDLHWSKSCGGLLAPSAQKELGIQGLGIPKEILVDPQLFGVRTMDYKSGREQFYFRNYFNMDREALDRWLFSLIPHHVEKKTKTVVQNITYKDGLSEIRTLSGGKMETCKAKLVVGADGAGSIVRRTFAKDKKIRQYVSFQQWFHQKEPLPFHSVLFDGNITDFYSWTIQKRDMIIIGAALPLGNDARERFELLKNRLREKGFNWGELRRSEGALINRPKSLSQIITGSNSYALLGEAAGLISPTSAEGISYALKSGRFLGKALEDGFENYQKRYRRFIRPAKRKLARQWLKSPGMYNPLLRNIVFISGIDGYKPLSPNKDWFKTFA